MALVLSYAERSANNADVLTSFLLAIQTLLTAGLGEEDDAESHSTVIFAIFAGGAVIALAQILHTVLVGIEPVRARLTIIRSCAAEKNLAGARRCSSLLSRCSRDELRHLQHGARRVLRLPGHRGGQGVDLRPLGRAKRC